MVASRRRREHCGVSYAERSSEAHIVEGDSLRRKSQWSQADRRREHCGVSYAERSSEAHIVEGDSLRHYIKT